VYEGSSAISGIEVWADMVVWCVMHRWRRSCLFKQTMEQAVFTRVWIYYLTSCHTYTISMSSMLTTWIDYLLSSKRTSSMKLIVAEEIVF
jgi:hypothetical protein